MAYEGFLRFGGNEVVNNERARGISSSADCPMFWLKGPRCDSLQDALGDAPYIYGNRPDAPWYDLSMPDVSGRFYGVFALSVSGLNDSTRSTQVTEGIDDGATIGRTRKSSRQVRVRAILIAQGRDALDYGVAWLNAALDPDACGQHGTGCGSTDLEFFTDCPPKRDLDETPEEYAARVEPYRRFLHGVAVTSGPLERELMNRGDFWGQVFEWTYTAGRPWVYSVTRPVDLPVTPTIVIQDTPYNLVPYPSAELPGAEVDTAINYSLNPSVEANATGWAGSAATLSGSAPGALVTSGRITAELQAVGSASFRVRLLGDGTALAGRVALSADQTVDVSGRAADARISVSIWAAVLTLGAAAVTDLISLDARLDWYTAADVFVSSESLGMVTDSDDLGGHVFAARSLAVPATAARVRITVRATFDWASGALNSDVRLYADALAVTVP